MTLVILAAGLGSRYGGLKQLDVVSNNDESIIDFSLYDAIEAGFKKVVFIVRNDILKQVKKVFKPKLKDKIDVEFVCQEIDNIPSEFKNNNRTKPWGTAHAVLMAKDVINENFCVINADDFYGKESFKKMNDFLKNTEVFSYNFSMIGYHLKNTLSENGTVSRGECIVNNNGYLQEIYERTSITKKNNKIVFIENETDNTIDKNAIVSMNFWGFTPKVFKELESQLYTFLKENYLTKKEEFFLPLFVNNLIKSKKASVKVLKTNANWIGITYKKDKEKVVSKLKFLKEKGKYPDKLWN